jgi:hypothetical protein
VNIIELIELVLKRGHLKVLRLKFQILNFTFLQKYIHYIFSYWRILRPDRKYRQKNANTFLQTKIGISLFREPVSCRLKRKF